MNNKQCLIELSYLDSPLAGGIPSHKIESIMKAINATDIRIVGIFNNLDGWVIDIFSDDFLEVKSGINPPVVKLDAYMFGISKKCEFPWDPNNQCYPLDVKAHRAAYGVISVPNIIISNISGITNVGPSGHMLTHVGGNFIWSPPIPKVPELPKPVEVEDKGCKHYYKNYYGKLEICIHCNEFKPS